MTPNTFEIVLALLIYLILIYQYKKLNKALILHPLSPPILIFGISVASVYYFNRLGYMNEKVYNILMIEFFIYFLFMLITPHLIKYKYTLMSNFMNIRKFDIQLTRIVFYVSLFIGIIYIIMLWGNYSSGSDRFILNRKMRELMLFNSLFSIWALSMSSIIYSKLKKHEFLYYAIILIILSGFMGARSAPIVGLLLFLFFYFQCNKINFKYIIILSIIVVGLVLLPTYLMYDENVFKMLLNRVFMAADIYLWSFQIGDYTKLIDFYDPISYLLHPFSSIIGIRGYEYGFGAQILETANLIVTGNGPNDQMPMLGLLFYNDCIHCIIVFSVIFSLIMMCTIIFIFYFFSFTAVSLAFRTLIFTLFYSASIYIFIGVNAFSFNIVIGIIGLIVFLFFSFLKEVSKKKEFNNDK